MRRQLTLVAILLTLAGCVTTANYEKNLDSWVGQTELSLIRKWGPPQRSYETGGHKFLVYVSSRNEYVTGTKPAYRTTVIGNTAYTKRVGRITGRNIRKNCQTTFEILGKRIVSWHGKGNDCKALE